MMESSLPLYVALKRRLGKGYDNTITKKGLIITATFVVSLCILWVDGGAQAQRVVSFTPDSPFSIHVCNATIHFAFNGSYSQAKLEDNTWVFSNLQVNSTRTWFFGDWRPINPSMVETFRVSAKSCNVTIISLFVSQGQDEQIVGNYNAFCQRMGSMTYNVSGPGVQSVNFDLSPSFGQNPRIRDVFVMLDRDLTGRSDANQQSDGWSISSDGTLTVTGATTEANIMCRDYSSLLIDESLPFHENHSVLVVSLVLVAGTVVFGVIIRNNSLKERRTH